MDPGEENKKLLLKFYVCSFRATLSKGNNKLSLYLHFGIKDLVGRFSKFLHIDAWPMFELTNDIASPMQPWPDGNQITSLLSIEIFPCSYS